MNRKHRPIIAIFALISIGFGTSAASAQLPDNPILTPLGYAVAFSTFIASGVFYSSSGYVKSVRRALAGEKVKLDYKKMAKSVMLGALIGVGAFIWSAYNGDSFVEITTVKIYLTQVSVNTTAILFVDKWILGRPDDTVSKTAKME